MTKKLSERRNPASEKHQEYSAAEEAHNESCRAICINIPSTLHDAITEQASLEGRGISEICKLALTQYVRHPNEKFSFSQPKKQREKSRYRELIAEGLQNYVDSHSAIREKS